MSRRSRNLLLGGAAVLVLTAALVALTLWDASEGEAEASPTETPEESFTLLEADSTTVGGVLVKPREGKSYEILYEDSVYSVKSDEALFPDNTSTLSSVFSAALKLSGLKRVALNASAETLAGYGLNTPELTWRINMRDGASHEFTLGAATVTGSGYYIRRTGSSDVYILDAASGKSLLRKREELYKLGFLPAELQGSTAENVTWNLFDTVRLEQSERTLDFDFLDEEELLDEEGNYFSSYRMNTPHDASVNENNFAESFMIPITSINPGSVVEIAPEDLSLYGLDKPDVLTMSDFEGWSGTLLIGAADGETGGRYVMQQGIDAVLLDTSGNYSFLAVEEFKLRLSTIWLHNINTVESVDFYLEGKERHLVIGYDDETMDCDGSLDGKPLSSANTKRLYRTALELVCSENYYGEIPDVEASFRVTMHLRNGNTSTVELFPINERQFAATLNGKNTDFLIFRTTIQQNVLNYFDIIDSGGDIA